MDIPAEDAAMILRGYADQIGNGSLIVNQFIVNITPTAPPQTDGTMVMDAIEIVIKAKTQ